MALNTYSGRERTLRIAYSGMLIATMMILGYIESMLPAVGIVPGVKMGLSNSVLIFAVYLLDLKTAWLLMVLKVTLNGLLFGVNTILYALSGGLLSMLMMTLLSRVPGMHPVTVSVVGGVMHNVGQVAMAMLIFQTKQLVFYMAVLIFIGMACGALTGVCAYSVMRHMRAIKASKKVFA